MKDYREVIKNRQFVYLWTSQILSQVTINIMNFLLLIRLFNETGSTIATSLLWVAYALPAIIIGPFAAASVDMLERRRVLMISNILQSLVIFLYAFSPQTTVFLLYGLAFSYSFFNQFYVPAEQAALPTIVSKKNLPHANGLFFLTQQSAVVFGFGLAGLLSATLGFDKSLYLGSAFIFGAFLSVSFLRQMKTKDKMPRQFEQAVGKFFKRILEGYKFIKDNTIILAPFILLISLQVALSVMVVNIPVLATQVLRIGVERSSLFIIVPAGLGAVTGAVLTPRLLRKGWRKKRVIEYGLMLLILAMFSYVFIVPELNDYLTRVSLGAIATVFAGVSFVSILIPSQTLLQEKTPGGLRGRVFGNFWFLVTVATIVPVILSGTISELFGVRTLLAILTGVTLFGLISFKRYGESFLANGITFLNGGTSDG